MRIMLPRPCATMTPPTARAQRNIAVRFRSTTRCHAASLSSRAGLRTLVPGMRTPTSRRPHLSRAVSTMAATCAGSATSTSTTTGLLARTAATAAAPAASRSARMTRAPKASRPRAIARPRPEAAPLTNATRPLRSNKDRGGYCHAAMCQSAVSSTNAISCLGTVRGRRGRLAGSAEDGAHGVGVAIAVLAVGNDGAALAHLGPGIHHDDALLCRLPGVRVDPAASQQRVAGELAGGAPVVDDGRLLVPHTVAQVKARSDNGD